MRAELVAVGELKQAHDAVACGGVGSSASHAAAAACRQRFEILRRR
jgi:hypothetical protein